MRDKVKVGDRINGGSSCAEECRASKRARLFQTKVKKKQEHGSSKE